MKFTWRVIEKTDVKTFWDGDEPFKVQTLVIEQDVDVQYPNKLAIDFSNDNLSLSWIAEIGQLVEISYATSVSTKEDRIFNRISGYKLRILENNTEENMQWNWHQEDPPF